MTIEHLKTSDLIPYARNAKKHDASQVAKIAGSIREFGFTNPVLIDRDNGIIAGHGRVLAAQSLALESVPCIRLGHLTDTQRRAYILADNRLAEIGGGWDEEMLKLELADLGELDVDLEAIGFGAEDLADLDMEDESETSDVDAEPQIDNAEELRAKWGVEPGQLWELGDHRLLCGDSTKKEDVERVMDGESAGICFTSPPYGQQRDYTPEGKEKVSDWDGLMNGVFGNLKMSDDGQVLVNLGLIHRDGECLPYWEKWIQFMKGQGYRFFGWYVWDQGFGLPGDWNGRFAPSHEFIFHFNKSAIRAGKVLDKKPENIKARKNGASTMRGKDGVCKKFSSPEASAQSNKIPDSIIRINRMSGGHDIDHPAIFPPQLPSFIISAWEGVAFEPFSGSGTTIIACEQLGRKCRAIEISPAYVAVAIQRWADATGKEPKRLA
jgi:DNA modification methylase